MNGERTCGTCFVYDEGRCVHPGLRVPKDHWSRGVRKLKSGCWRWFPRDATIGGAERKGAKELRRDAFQCAFSL